MSYNLLLGDCARCGDSQRAHKGFRTVQRTGVTSNTACHNLLINVHARTGGRASAARWLGQLRANPDALPECVNFNTAIKAIARDGDVQGAEHWYDEMKRPHLDPDTACNAMDGARARAREPERVEH